MIPKIVEAIWPDAAAEIGRLRREVFIVEQQVPEDLEWDDADAAAKHFCLWLDADLVGYGRLLLSETGRGKLTRMAIKRAWRAQGLGCLLLQQIIDRARDLGVLELVLDAQLTAVGLYRRQGFEAQGAVFIDAGIEHIAMKMRLID